MKSKRILLLYSLLTLFTASIYGQEAPANAVTEALDSTEEENADADEGTGEPRRRTNVPLTPEMRRQELEIKTSTLPELAAWCRSLELSEGGTREELSRRLREHLGLPEPRDRAASNQKVITIESAQSTEYFTIEVIGEDYARLKGDVRLTLKDKDSTHNIKAEEILFNRTRNILTAKGNVEYIKDKGGTTEIFRGENITVNIDDWSSVFLDGNSEKTLTGETTAYRFEGKVITRNNEDVTILNDASVSNANNEEALWSIRASKIWLLPGSDFAIFNALLKVGEIPVLYIPFFYFPADEVVFHPVIGYRSREGGFTQTTTYILGRPKASSADQSSLAKIMGNSNDMEKEPNGIFLKSTGKKIADSNETSLRALVDYYTNLGFYFGLDLSTPKAGILNPLDFSLGIGLTRTLENVGANENPFAPNYDGTFNWNQSNLFSKTVPFRYRMELKSSISGKYGTFSWNLPFFSDPYVNSDFLDRSESMDWVNMMQQGAAIDITSSTDREQGPQNWNLSGQLYPSLRALAPYVNSISLSNISMSLAFKTLENENLKNTNDPARNFFAPDRYTIYSISGSISGAPVSIGGTQSANTSANQTGTADTSTESGEKEDLFKGIGIPRSPWAAPEEEEKEKSAHDDTLVPPVLSQRFELPRAGNLRFNIDYQMSPTSSSELQFMSGKDKWKSNEDINWSDIQSVLSSAGGNATVNFSQNHSNDLFSNSLSFSGGGTWRGFVFQNEEADAYAPIPGSPGKTTEQRMEEERRNQYRNTNYLTSYAYTGKVRPFYSNPIFSQTSFQYNFGGTLVRSKTYNELTSPDGPELTPSWGAWVKQQTKDGELIPGLTGHRVTSNVTANVFEKNQTLSLSADLPPIDPLIAARATFRIWKTETDAHINFKKPEFINNEPNDEWKIDPFHLTETVTFSNRVNFKYYMVMSPEKDNRITTITSSVTLWDFQAVFNAVELRRSEFVFNDPKDPTLGGAWKQLDEDPFLNPRDFSMSYNRTFPNMEIIKNRFSLAFNINAGLFFNLQEHTRSNFQFSTGFTAGINNFLDLSLSAKSKNNVIFRYFKNVPGMEDLTVMYKPFYSTEKEPQNNLFIDLFDSFNFFNEEKRRSSGFKMETFTIKATHHLGDWKAILGIDIYPYLNMTLTPPKHEINTDVSFLVQWSAITEIKSDIKYEKKTERWIVK
jgi:lipopolysaccharide assembly outer membrane protein LptD (OstA)